MDVKRSVLDRPLTGEDIAGKIDHQKIARSHFGPMQPERRQQEPVCVPRQQQREVVVDALVIAVMHGKPVGRSQIDPCPALGCDAVCQVDSAFDDPHPSDRHTVSDPVAGQAQIPGAVAQRASGQPGAPPAATLLPRHMDVM